MLAVKYFCPILDMNDPPEDKELPDPSRPLSKVIPSEQAKWSFTKNGYTKLTPCSNIWLPHILINMETTHNCDQGK